MSETTELTVPQRAAIALGTAEHEQKLIALSTKYADIKELKNTAAREQCHSAYMELKNTRVAIEKAGKDAREDANAFQKAVIDEVKRLAAITADEEARLQFLRDEYDLKVAQEKEAKRLAEAERIRSIKARIERFMLDAVTASDGTSAEIDAHATRLSEMVISLDEFAEFAGEAQVKRNDTVKWLRERQAAQAAVEQAAIEAARQAEADRIERERVAAEQKAEAQRLAGLAAELHRQATEARAKQAEADRIAQVERERVDGIRERIAQIKATVAMQAGKPSTSIESAIKALELMEINSAEFGEFFLEADTARANAFNQLHEMFLSMRAHEESQTEIARQQAEIAAAKAEQERIAREAQEATEREAARLAQEEADRVFAEQQRIAAEQAAEAARIQAEQDAAEAERLRRERVQFEQNGPEPTEIIAVLADHYNVSPGVARHWLGLRFWAQEEEAA